MVQLTKAQVKFLLKNEDRISIKKFSQIFNCSTKEVYEIYNQITNSDAYKDYQREKILRMSRKGETNDDKVGCFKKDRENENEIDRELPGEYTDLDCSDRDTDYIV